ncbi:MAG: ABC-2 transporter permease [Defluviitaleaceae bacterium]|nr:ABC-2 transporter permease [Defluviitaleaceae bacterium]
MKGLCGALLNNIYLMKTRGMFFSILLALGGMVVYLVTDNAAARQVSIIVFLLIVPLTSLNSANIAFDSKWNHIEKILGVSPFTMIAARYIVYVVISIAFSALWVLSPFHDGNLQNIADFVTLVLFVGAIFFPVMYILNSDHNIGILVIFFAAAVGFIILNQVTIAIGHSWENGIDFALAGAVFGVYLVSLGLSYGFNMFHRGRGV